MDADEIVEFLTWLEGTFVIEAKFANKQGIAENYVTQRSWKTWKEHCERQADK